MRVRVAISSGARGLSSHLIVLACRRHVRRDLKSSQVRTARSRTLKSSRVGTDGRSGCALCFKATDPLWWMLKTAPSHRRVMDEATHMRGRITADFPLALTEWQR